MPHGDDSTWVQTFTGRQFWPMDPHEDDIDIQDIAHALSMMCRFNGHCRDFYSVAQHSVHVAEVVAERGYRKDTLTALLHDAAEAYFGDITRPVKHGIGGEIARIEGKLEMAIANKFGLHYPFPPIVKEIDDILLVTEKRDVMTQSQRKWNLRAEPLEQRIVPWDWRWARSRFLEMYHKLTIVK